MPSPKGGAKKSPKHKSKTPSKKTPKNSGGGVHPSRKRKVGPELVERAKFNKPPYIQEWVAFESEVQRIFLKNPNNTRLFTKYRADDKYVDVKVTDDINCVKFLITEQADIYQLEKLNLWFLEQALSNK